MYECSYQICQSGMDRPGKFANPARGHLNRIFFFPCPHSRQPEKLVSRDGFARSVQRQPGHSLYSGSIWCLLTGSLPLSATLSLTCYVYRQPPSWQFRAYIWSHSYCLPRAFTAESSSAQGQQRKYGCSPIPVFCFLYPKIQTVTNIK